MAGKIVNNVKYIALIDSDSDVPKSFNEHIWYVLKEVFLNCSSENDTKIANSLMLSFVKNTTKYYPLDDGHYKKIYGFLNSLEERSFYFAEEPFEEDTEYVEFDIWWNQLQELIKKLENIIINMQS